MRPVLRACRRGLRRVTTAFQRLLNRYPKRTTCNVCGWRGRRFDTDAWHKNVLCPQCGSVVRHRLLHAVLFADSSGQSIVSGKAVLHFAPEAALTRAIRRCTATYVTADIGRTDVDLNVDVTDMATVPSGAFDIVIACDVLEHVSDDRKAMREIRRVLRDGGRALITVPQKDRLSDTYEDSTLVTPSDRERAFGQWDHLRIYGDNFSSILESTGFLVSAVSETAFPPEVVKTHVLCPPVLSVHPLATNHRKVFVATRL